MARKRAAKSPSPPPPPTAASSSEETDSRSRSQESEDEGTAAVSPPLLIRNPPQRGEDSETTHDDDEGESSESDEEAPPPEPMETENLKPPPEPMETENLKPPPEPMETENLKPPPEPMETENLKPPPEPMETENLKPPPPSGEVKKAGGIPRIWSTDNEVRILEALAAHRQAHGVLPQPDALMEALAGKLDNRAYGVKELHSKQTTLRQRYNNAVNRGELPTKEHDRRLYDLSNMIWGDGKAAASAANANGGGPREFAEMCELYPYLAEEVKELEAEYPGMFKREFGKMDDHTARAMDGKVKRQRLVQMKVVLRRGDLAKEVTKTLMELLD